MRVLLHPRATTPGKLQVWLGIWGARRRPELTWRLDGAPAAPQDLRPLKQAWLPTTIATSNPDGLLPRSWTGLYEFDAAPGVAHRVSVDVHDVVEPNKAITTKDLTTSTLPEALSPVGPDAGPEDGWFNILLVSCFHQSEASAGWGERLEREWLGKPAHRPHVTLFMGDQVYLDLPTLKNFKDDACWLAEKFERDYLNNWFDGDGFGRLLGMAPAVFVPDDHEFWNNAPHKSPFIGNSHSEEGRQRWIAAASALLEAFQAPHGGTVRPGSAPDESPLGRTVRIDISPLSILLADGRSLRDSSLRWTLPGNEGGGPDARGEVERWVRDVAIDSSSIGLFVSGQSLFRDPVSGFAGKTADWELPNYGDYKTTLTTLDTAARAGAPLFAITGDVHWGRVTVAGSGAVRGQWVEVIVSPASLVTTVGADTWNNVTDFLGGIFGSRDPWPRHPKPEKPPALFGKGILPTALPTTMAHAQRGNHVALLSFRLRSGVPTPRIECRIQYISLHDDRNVRTTGDRVIGPFAVNKPVGVSLPELTP
ncbi:MAG: hypothetical protein JNJ88_15830 [Planctomycetes bacterium]|nr:hypothetical protein [Planctomycetota bacterium]